MKTCFLKIDVICIQKVAVVILCVVFLMAWGCGSKKMSDIEGSDSISCENKKILKILNDEPAIVRKQCFEHVGRVDTFYFELVNRHFEFFSDVGVFPVGVIPQQYRKEGLSVYISGNVTSCYVLGGCSEPNIRVAFIPLFELKSININE